MITSITSLRLCRTALFALGCALTLAFAPVLRAADAATEKGASLPLTTTFEKVSEGETGPFVLKLKNDSKETIKITAKVLLSVAFHAESKARNVPEQSIAAGKTVTIPGLAADDKVILTAHGYAPLELTVK